MQGTVLQLQCHFRQKNSTPLRSHFHISLGVQSFLWIFHQKDHHSKKQLSPTNSTVAMDKTAYSGKLLQTFTPVTEQFVLDILQKTIPKSWDLDPSPIKLLYENLDVLLPIITNINTSLASSLVPPDYKTAIVKPLLQKPSLDENVLNNERPSNFKYTISVQNSWKVRSTQTLSTPPRKQPLQCFPVSLPYRTQHRDRTPTRCKPFA